MVEFRPMTAEQYQAYYRYSVQQYAAEAVKNGNWTAQEAPEKAAQQFESILPQGQDTPGHAFYDLIDAERREQVGLLWVMLRGAGEQRHAFIYDIEINAAQQGRGYGRQALERLKSEAAAQGANYIGLHVFGHNTVARHLYESLGFYPTNINMRLDL